MGGHRPYHETVMHTVTAPPACEPPHARACETETPIEAHMSSAIARTRAAARASICVMCGEL